MASPRSRGSARGTGGGEPDGEGFPALAGIGPTWEVGTVPVGRLPRARGDRPLTTCSRAWSRGASPRSRGSARWLADGRLEVVGFPALAGIGPARPTGGARSGRLPRARGDRPPDSLSRSISMRASPRSRGSARLLLEGDAEVAGFPALAGIGPRPSPPPRTASRLPRARGDRPHGPTPSPAR